MREIKFRAWDDDDNKMYYFDLRDYMQTREDGQEELCTSHASPTLMQFTGVKDKNGKEVYEGDIIQLIDDAGDTIRTEVKWGNHRRQMGTGVIVDIPGFAFIKPDGAASFPIVNNYQGKHDTEIFEIVGNIYEHPQLVKNNYSNDT